MYPVTALDELTQRKLVLRQSIARNRAHCTRLAADVVRPLALIDQVRAQWRRLAPVVKLAAVPLALLLRRGRARRGAKTGFLRRAWLWLPVVLSAARVVGAWRSVR